MAFTATNSTAEPRAWSTGPLKEQHMTWTRLSTDTSGTVTFDALAEVRFVEIHNIVLSAATAVSGNGATLSFDAVAAAGVGTVVGYGI